MKDLEERKQLHSGAYVEWYEDRPLSRIERLVPFLRLSGNDLLADFACGNAMLLPLVHDRVAMYHGVDFSSDFIEASKRRAKKHQISNCKFYCQDIVEFCEQHVGEFDVATALDFSEHIYDDDFRHIFSAIRKSLKPGGQLLIHTPNLEFFMERLKDVGVLRQFPEHIAVRTGPANVALLRDCGFASDQITVHGVAHYNILRFVDVLRHIPLIGRLFVARLVIDCVR